MLIPLAQVSDLPQTMWEWCAAHRYPLSKIQLNRNDITKRLETSCQLHQEEYSHLQDSLIHLFSGGGNVRRSKSTLRYRVLSLNARTLLGAHLHRICRNFNTLYLHQYESN